MEALFPSNIYCMCCGCLIERNRHYSLCDECLGKIHWITDGACDKCGKDLGKHFLGSTCYNCMLREHKFVRGEHVEFDVIVPVPVHKDREKKRGYNQTAIMAARLAELIHIPVRINGCTRVKSTKLLRSMDPLQREAAMAGAFAVTESEKKHILGKKILLIDDIITTGATVDACAGALLDAGAECVYLLTLASGGNRKPSDIDN